MLDAKKETIKYISQELNRTITVPQALPRHRNSPNPQGGPKGGPRTHIARNPPRGNRGTNDSRTQRPRNPPRGNRGTNGSRTQRPRNPPPTKPVDP
jgi:hypothetical protein